MQLFKFDTWTMVVITMAALAGIGMYALKGVVLPPGLEPAQQPHILDFYLKDFTLVSMDKQGSPQHRLRADYMQHYVDDETSQLTVPKLVVSGASEPWHLHAENGWSSAQGDEVWLGGEVVIVRVGADRGLSVATRDMRVLPNEQYAETSAPVIIQNHVSLVRGVGMRANLKDDRFELLSQVRGDYARH